MKSVVGKYSLVGSFVWIEAPLKRNSEVTSPARSDSRTGDSDFADGIGGLMTKVFIGSGAIAASACALILASLVFVMRFSFSDGLRGWYW